MCSMLIHDKKLWLILAAAMVRMGSFGFNYFPLLDDYIQYGIYPFAYKPFESVYLKAGLFAYRPLAALADIYLWGRFWGALGIVFFSITIMHAVSAYLFIKTSERLNVPLGMTFAAIYLLCPINIEASYWISASSRIIVGLFLSSLSAYFLSRDKPLTHTCFQFIAMFLYEQIAVLSFVLSFIIILRKKNWRGLLPLAGNILIFTLYYGFFIKTGQMRGNISREIPGIDNVKQILYPWFLSGLYINGFARGARLGGINLIAAIVISIYFGVFEKRQAAKPAMFIIGAALFAAPQIPILLLAGNNVSFRTCATSLAGAAIMADTLLCFTAKLKRAAVTGLCFVFMIVCISELADYRENYFTDRKITQYVADRLSRAEQNAVIGAKDTYITQNVFFVDHIKSVTSSDWALTGCMRQHFGDRTIPIIQINPAGDNNINLISLIDF